MIEVNNLIFDYPHFRALKDISFTIPEGSITALVGPNGAGKTTLFNCIAGLEQPFSGVVKVNGIEVVEEPRVVHRTVGFLPDFFGLYETLTVKKSLHYFAMAHRINETKIGHSIIKTAKRLGIFDKIDEKVSSLSRGMRQRLAIGQIIIGEPKVLLLDEPASGLDPEARYNLGELFKELKDDGMTIIVSSHILAELEQYADDLLIIEQGKIINHTLSEKSEEQSTITISIELLNSRENLCEFLNSYNESPLSIVSDKEKALVIELVGDTTCAHKLLKTLIDENFEIFDFTIETQNMQNRYMDLVKDSRKGDSHE